MATETISQESQYLTFGVERDEKQERRDVTTTLNYYHDSGDGSSPMPVYVGGGTVTNERPTAPTQVTVRDMTGSENKYTLDTHGFQLVKHQTGLAKDSFKDEEKIFSQYYKESEQVYKNFTGASSVRLFGHLVRRGPTHWHKLGAGNASKKGPLHRVHIDQSYSGAELVLRKQVGEEHAAKIIKSGKRWQIINLWRPITTVYKDPLGVASAPSIPESSLIEAEVQYVKQPPPFNKNLTWTVLPPNPSAAGHEWYYKNEQTPEEVLLIKCFDSLISEGKNEGKIARRAPHCAFVDPERDGEEWSDRESVEIRAICIFD